LKNPAIEKKHYSQRPQRFFMPKGWKKGLAFSGPEQHKLFPPIGMIANGSCEIQQEEKIWKIDGENTVGWK